MNVPSQPPPSNNLQHPTGTIIQKHSKTVAKLLHPIRYKLNLTEFTNPLEGISYAIEKFYTWSSNNYIDFIDYVKQVSRSNENAQLLMLVDYLTTLYIRAHTQRGTGGWGEGVSIYRPSYGRGGLIYGVKTYAEVFAETGLPFPDELKEERDNYVENIDQLYQSGIFDDLIKAIRVQLSQNDYLETQYLTLVNGGLSLDQQRELASKMVNNKEFYQYDPYFKLTWDELGLSRPEDRRILLAKK